MFDVDLSGYVDTNEFVLGMAAACDATLVEKLSSYFDMVDVDGSGSLSQEERCCAPPTLQSVAQMLPDLRLNWQEIEDMLVSSHAFNTFTQIRANVNKIMEMLDPDGSNSITLAEFQASVLLWPRVGLRWTDHFRLACPCMQDGLIRYPDIVKIFDRCFGTTEGDLAILEDLRAQQAPTPREEGPKRGAAWGGD